MGHNNLIRSSLRIHYMEDQWEWRITNTNYYHHQVCNMDLTTMGISIFISWGESVSLTQPNPTQHTIKKKIMYIYLEQTR